MQSYQFRIELTQRKKLANTIADFYHTKAEYKMPDFRYVINKQITVNKYGIVEVNPKMDTADIATLLDYLADHGFCTAKKQEEPDILGISVPAPNDKGHTRQNIECFIQAYRPILAKIFETNCFLINEEDGKLSFPWFKPTDDPEITNAYMEFITKLIKTAQNSARMSAKPVALDNEKFTWRTCLLHLGFIGDQYKQTRKILMKNLEGNSAFRHANKTRKDGNL
jgi:hypothetical protein